ILLANASNGAQTSPVRNGSLPSVSPDGTHIAFFSTSGSFDDLFVTTSDGGEKVRLTNTLREENFAGWLPDSKHVVFSDSGTSRTSIYLIDIEGKNQRTLATIDGRSPSFSPDGRQMVYASGSWTEMALLLSPADGSISRQINDGKSIAWNI